MSRLPEWRPMMNRLLLLVGLGIGGTLIYTLLTTDRDSLLGLLHFRPGYLLLAMLLAVLPWLGHSLRLWIWSRFFQCPLSSQEVFRIAIATDLGGAVMPTAVGGAPIKIGMLMQKGFSAAASGLMVALASLEDVLFFVLFAPIALLLIGNWELPSVNFSFLLSGLILLTLLSLGLPYLFKRHSLLALPFLRRSVKRQRQLVKFRRSIREFKRLVRLIWREGKLPFLCSMCALVFQWLCRFSILAALMLALGLEVELLNLWLLQWMVFISMVFVPTPGATGGAEAAFILIFGTMLPEALIGILATGWRFLTYYFILLLAILLLFLTRTLSTSR